METLLLGYRSSKLELFDTENELLISIYLTAKRAPFHFFMFGSIKLFLPYYKHQFLHNGLQSVFLALLDIYVFYIGLFVDTNTTENIKCR